MRILGSVHASHAQNDNQSGLGSFVHLQSPNYEHGEDCKGGVGNQGEGAVDTCDCENGGHRNAGSRLGSIPEIRNRVTLEKCDKEERQATNGGDSHVGVDDPLVYSVRGHTEKEKSYRPFGGNHCSGVRQVTQIPVLRIVSPAFQTL